MPPLDPRDGLCVGPAIPFPATFHQAAHPSPPSFLVHPSTLRQDFNLLAPAMPLACSSLIVSPMGEKPWESSDCLDKATAISEML